MLKELLRASRSYRSFDESVKISRELLLDWIDGARLCPSSVNLQLLKFRLVLSRQECDLLLANTRWAGKCRDIQLPPQGQAPVAYVVICSDQALLPNADQYQKDVGICAQSILLAACEAGFGGCMLGSFDPAIASLLHLPSTLKPQLVLALGKPAEQIELVDLDGTGDTAYYRLEGIHYVPKRTLEDIVIEQPQQEEI